MASRKTNFMHKILGGDKATQAAWYSKRIPTLKKKALLLHKLCDISVVLVSYGPDGRLDIWPENQEDVKAAILSYKALPQKLKCQANVSTFLEDKKTKLVKRKRKVLKGKLDRVIETLSKHLDGLSNDQELIEFVNFCEEKLKGFQKKLIFLEMSANHQVKSLNHPLVSCVDDDKSSIQRMNGLQWNYDNYYYYYSSANTNAGQYLMNGNSNYEAVNGNMGYQMDKQILMNKNVALCDPNKSSEYYVNGNNFLGSSSSGAVAKAEEVNGDYYYDNNVTMVNQFNNNNNNSNSNSNIVVGSTSNCGFGFGEMETGVDEMLEFLWDGEIV